MAVHSLACTALEHAEYLASEVGQKPLKTHIIQTIPRLQEKDFKRLRNKHWTVIKHSHDLKGQPFDVKANLSDFHDSSNDAVLFSGWYDYMKCDLPIPVAAQVFQAWFFRVYPETMNPDRDFFFPPFDGLHALSRDDQKKQLRKQIAAALQWDEVLQHPNTDNRPLVVTARV